MQFDAAARSRAAERLEPLVGEWREQVPGGQAGRMTFEWTLDRRYLLQRSDIPDPEFPDSIAIIAVDPDGQGYTQHYFDSRGVVRVYAMSLDGRRWSLVRNAADFSPLEFSQRFTGTFSDDGDTIDATWESSPDGVVWTLDFPLTYTRVDSTRH